MNDTAWCPICFDALECIEVKDENEMIKSHIYECFGCSKQFELKEFDIGERVFGNIRSNTKKEEEEYERYK